MKSLGKARLATMADMEIIKAWLPKDRSIGTLAANWNITMDSFFKGEVSVWEDEASGKPVAYCWGTLNSHDSILEVQPEYRGQGVGRSMAAFMLEKSITSGEPLLEIQIAPESSEPFWKAMGFETHRERDLCYGRLALELRRDTPAGVTREVVVTFLPERAAWEPNAKPLAVHQVVGMEIPGQGKIFLDATIAQFDPLHGGDLVVDVVVSGQCHYRGKAKYEDAAAIGVQRCRNGFKINEILKNR